MSVHDDNNDSIPEWTICPGRRIGSRIGKDAFRRALVYFDGTAGN